MNRLNQFVFLCGIVLTLAAFPVFAQEQKPPESNSQPVSRVELTRTPLLLFADSVIDRVEKKEVVLSDNFLVEFESEFAKDGKLDPQKSKFVRIEGNGKIVDVVKNAVEAINDAGFLRYLKQFDANKINLILAQNDEQIYGTIKFDTVSPTKSKSIKSTLEMLFSMSINTNNNENDKKLLEGTTVSAEDKFVTIKTSVPKSVGQEMIQKSLNKRIERKAKAGR